MPRRSDQCGVGRLLPTYLMYLWLMRRAHAVVAPGGTGSAATLISSGRLFPTLQDGPSSAAAWRTAEDSLAAAEASAHGLARASSLVLLVKWVTVVVTDTAHCCAVTFFLENRFIGLCIVRTLHVHEGTRPAVEELKRRERERETEICYQDHYISVVVLFAIWCSVGCIVGNSHNNRRKSCR